MNLAEFNILQLFAIVVGSLFGIVVLTAIVLGSLPADYFIKPAPARPRSLAPMSVLRFLFRNFIGMLLVIAGLIVTSPALPLLPGSGFVVCLMGVILMDLPGKQRLLLAIIKRRRVAGLLNWSRRRLGRDEFMLPESVSETVPAQVGALLSEPREKVAQ